MSQLLEILGKIGFEWHLALAHLINFLILFFLLVKFALPKIKKTIDERNQKIKEGLEMRKNADKIVDDANLSAENILRDATAEKSKIILSGEEMQKKIVSETKEDASKILLNAKNTFDNAQTNGFEEGSKILTSKIPSILEVISKNAFSKNITPELNNDFIKNVLKESYENK